MKNYVILFGLLFSIFIIPKDVFAAGSDLYSPYYNKVENFDLISGEGESLKNFLYDKLPEEYKKESDSCILIYNPSLGFDYHLICDISRDYIDLNYNSTNSNFSFSLKGSYYRFTSDYTLSSSVYTSYIFLSSKNSFENVFLYSDLPFKFNINAVSNLFFYDLNDSSKVYGQFNTTDLYTYKDFYLTESSDDVVVFQDNDFHSISKLILGDSIPEEFSFVYTISDYLLCLLLVGILISPIAIIIKIMRW